VTRKSVLRRSQGRVTLARRVRKRRIAGHLLKDATHDVSPLITPAASRGRIARQPVMSGRPAGFSLSDGWDLSGLTLSELWLRYLAVGGTASRARVGQYARGQLRPDTYQHNMIAHAINEYFTDRGEDHPVSYQDIPALPQRPDDRDQRF
jgi:hypothetical protein